MNKPEIGTSLQAALHLSLAALVLAGCGGGGGGGLPSAAAPAPAPAPAPAAPAPAALSAADACSALQSVALPPSSLSLPTNGATVTDAVLKPPVASAAGSTGEYCEVKGVIASVDRTAPPISFQVNLPSAWNKKAFQLMGGGYDGSVVTGTGGAPSTTGFQTPLSRGYVTFGSDSGHAGSALDGSFGVNDEALENYFGDQLRKTRDVAVVLMNQRYGSGPAKTYAAGGSGGGREALYVADRWPDLYDGVIAYYPAWSLTSMLLNYGRISKDLAAPGAYPSPAKQALIAPAVIAACDALDGVSDGIVSRPAACQFDIQTLRCPGGADTAATCLSDAQIAGIRSYDAGLTLPYILASGANSYPGFNVLKAGVHLEGFAMGTSAPAAPSTFAMPFATYIFDSLARFWVMRDSNLDPSTFDVGAPAFVPQRLNYISSRLDVRTDLTPFAKKGGKLIMVTGQADAIIPGATSVDFYNRLATSMGAGSLANFMRFYYVPGFDHGNGPQFNLSWDSVTALEQWVENGTAPASHVGADINPGANGRTRPLCDFPTWPRYNGAGDPAVASSFTCIP
ncbi:tannase/feruloyl esterase family alpha/beta hydrolase [Variovorax sp. J22R24]|uniref:tannase/feruloyl esterase family alpha/beta hydrolase n=1 Tax=Variovorax gracilis TaxID=3053502 RepID=UPI002574DC0D|nr:tannase/feruloyl esterase family alpha/beta hydrolase [Variovorax sp. J22R24]MDM0109250.1 tannase/feruloyl esterase family alpha/beta hydrolase [Variovorax sp. J22R24]